MGNAEVALVWIHWAIRELPLQLPPALQLLHFLHKQPVAGYIHYPTTRPRSDNVRGPIFFTLYIGGAFFRSPSEVHCAAPEV